MDYNVIASVFEKYFVQNKPARLDFPILLEAVGDGNPSDELWARLSIRFGAEVPVGFGIPNKQMTEVSGIATIQLFHNKLNEGLGKITKAATNVLQEAKTLNILDNGLNVTSSEFAIIGSEGDTYFKAEVLINFLYRQEVTINVN